jgi:hypothetical protein
VINVIVHREGEAVVLPGTAAEEPAPQEAVVEEPTPQEAAVEEPAPQEAAVEAPVEPAAEA